MAPSIHQGSTRSLGMPLAALGMPPGLCVQWIDRGRALIVVRFSLERLRSLTSAELDVARLASLNHSNDAIAQLRGTSGHTVARQMSNVLMKLGMSSRASLSTLPELAA
jgi:DNA-binding CsgD family transcriptional regulator